MGPFVGPGEERTALTLRDQLPDDWEIVAGRKLPGRDRDDLDLIVVASNLIFVLDEKAWGPTVITGDQWWEVKHQRRRNPLDRVAHLSRRLAGLPERIATYRRNVAPDRVVRAGVVLSHPSLQLLAGRHDSPDELVLPLAEAARTLTQLDATNPSQLRLARSSVLRVLTEDLPGRPVDTAIGDYRVLETRPPLGRATCFLAEHSLAGQEVLLRCYPRSGWGDHDPGAFIRRELDALQGLADIDRTWQHNPPFIDEDNDWYVLPLIPPRDCTAPGGLH